MRPLAALGSLALAGCSVVGVRGGTEEPAFEVVAQADGFEVRRYGARAAADTVVEADSEEAARNRGFRRLAAYIFGNNRADLSVEMTAPVEQAAGETIAMTAPVAQAKRDAGGWRIRFYLPAGYSAESAPRPVDDRVEIVDLPPETLAVRRFSGSRSGPAVARQTQALVAALDDSRWRQVGAPVAWFYDPPWTLPAFRRNEVAVPVEGRD